MAAPRRDSHVRVPVTYPTSIVYVDESGTAGNGRHFTIGAIKVRDHGAFARAIGDVRGRHDFREEFRFNRISRAKIALYYDLIDTLCSLNVHLSAAVVDRDVFDPFTLRRPRWQAHADVVAQLLRGCINKRELVSVALDIVTTPRGVSMEDEVRRRVNQSFRNASIVTAMCLDSRTADGLQVADIFAGAVNFEQKLAAGDGQPNSHRGKVLRRFHEVMNVNQLIGRTPRLNVAILRGPQRQRRPAERKALLRPVPAVASTRAAAGKPLTG